MENNKLAVTLKGLLTQDDVKARFIEVLGKQANTFISSLISVANNNEMLKNAEPVSIMQAGIMAATLNLPINQNLGFAYIIPYNAKQKDGTYKTVAQFQVGYKGIIQLAQRSGQFQTINVTDVRQGEIKTINRLTGEIEFDWCVEKREDKIIIGYVAYFELLNGFKKSLYMTNEQLTKHGLKYSQTFKNEKTKKYSLWETAFETMSSKTVLKLLISKYAPLSIEMQRAIISDQSIIKDSETLDIDYIDANNHLQEPVHIKDLKLLLEMKKATLTEQELIDANRIIDEEEINSYQKLFKNLSAK